MAAVAPVVAPPRVTEDVEAGDPGGDYAGWFCVATDPWPCPAAGCDFVALHLTAVHLIVVWPRRDDPALLGQARSASLLGRNPRVVDYERALGPCIPWDEWWRRGRPVHALAARPDGWKEDGWRL